jgi:hypothetical protein
MFKLMDPQQGLGDQKRQGKGERKTEGFHPSMGSGPHPEETDPQAILGRNRGRRSKGLSGFASIAPEHNRQLGWR